jgi:hypothetical protein
MGDVTMFGEFTFDPPVEDTTESTVEFAALLGERSPDVRDRAVELIEELLAVSDVDDRAGRVDVRVLAEPGTIRIEVRDGGSGLVLGSLRRGPGASSRGGWSPPMLSAMADRWGLVSGSSGAWVWFELDTSAGKER